MSVLAGNLFVQCEIEAHQFFTREENDVHVTVPISIATAVLGGLVKVPTIDGGKARVKVPAGSQTGKQMRLRAKGMPALRGGGVGDMLLELAVETPVNLTSRQKELLREFEELSEDNNPEGRTFFSKVKGFWDGMKG
jgi:molecular chaperone DnaJ